MPEYYNNNNHAIHLTGPDGKPVRIKGKQQVTLPSYFSKYLNRGVIQLANTPKRTVIKSTRTKLRVRVQSKQPKRNTAIKTSVIKSRRPKQNHAKLGKEVPLNPNQLLHDGLTKHHYPISNNIGIGILSYNRLGSLQRLINSIIKYTDLRKTTVFISDDGSTDAQLIAYLDELNKTNNFIVLFNQPKLGIAGNSNRLLRCLSRFTYGLLLNDDVEILNHGWDDHYPKTLLKSGLHHLIHHELGVYGGKDDYTSTTKGCVTVRVRQGQPQGAILAFDNHYLNSVGYFDESYGLYGMEHVDWSNKAFEFNVQSHGYFNSSNSNEYFLVHSEESAVEERHKRLLEAKAIFANRTPQACIPSRSTIVPSISYVVPFRNINREDSILSVVNNLRAQRYPNIEILMSEQDSKCNIKLSKFQPVRHCLAESNTQFNKSKAFNLGFKLATYEKVILHDADMLMPSHYTAAVAETLEKYESCHLGKTVIYTSKASTDAINNIGVVDNDAICDKVVGYFEGGSLACTKSAYWKVGGFNEEYNGYGCFAPGNFILTDNGYKKIEDISDLDKLYTHEERFKSIELRKRVYCGDMLNIYIPGRLPIKGVTPEHPFLIECGDNTYKWQKAHEIQKGDVIVSTDYMPELVNNYNLNELIINDKSKNSFSIYDHMHEFCYLLGIYLADGVLQTLKRLRTVYLYLNESEEFLASHVAGLVHKLHPNINVNYDYVKNNCREVRIFNSLLAKSIYAVAGKHIARNKILSHKFINERSNDELSLLLGGGCDGDANHNNGSEKRLVYHTSSVNLAMLYSAIMRKLHIAHSFGRRSGGSFPGSADIGFDLCVNREFEHLIKSKYDKPPVIGSNSSGKSKFGTVYNIKHYQYNGLVYNFEVKDDHSYVVNGLITHNCEDCDFYNRLSRASNWLENRIFDLLHLWHDRTPGWDDCHANNKKLEAKLNLLSTQERVHLQHKQLRNLGYL